MREFEASGFRLSSSFGESPGLFESQAQRTRFKSGALSWINANLRYFDPPQEELVAEASPDRILPGRTRKAFGELGAALRLLARAEHLRDDDQVVHLREEWLRATAQRNIFFDIRRRVHLFPHAAVALAVIHALGGPVADARHVLQSVLNRRFMDRTERSAWQKLDLKYYFEAAGLHHAFPDDAELLQASCILAIPALSDAIPYDIYAITHLIFHFTDFGERPITSLSDRQYEKIDDYVGCALASYLFERNYDLVTELLMCRRCLRRPVTDLDRIAVDTLCDAQQPQGFIPDPRWLRGLSPQNDPDTTAEQLFFAVYHPTVLALFLLACERVVPLSRERLR